MRLWLYASVALATLVALGFDGTIASATEPVVEENLPIVTAHVARGGAVAVPDVTCDATCQNWWDSEQALALSAPGGERFHRQLRTIRRRSRVLPKLRLLQKLSLYATVGYVGWRIGSGLNAKYLQVGAPPESPGSGAYDSYPEEIRFTAAGTSLPQTKDTMPEDGWLWKLVAGRYVVERPGDDPCARPLSPPQGFVINPGGSHSCGTYQVFPLQLDSYYLPEDELPAAAAIEDYVGQPSTQQTLSWPDQPTTEQQLETLVGEALASGQFPLVEAYWAHQLDPRNYDEATDRDEDCELSDPASGEDPGIARGSGSSGAEFLRRYEAVPESVFLTAGLPTVTGNTAHLKWGVAFPSVANSHIEWRGWGYRKIKAKHGWTPADVQATAEALLTTAVANPGGSGRVTYTGPQYGGRGGALCARIVVVDHEQSSEEIDQGAPGSAGVITSFGKKLG